MFCFPFADLRIFLGSASAQLAVPNWSDPDIGKDFVRAFGPIKRQSPVLTDGLKGWPLEKYHCELTSGPSFSSLPAMYSSDGYLQWRKNRSSLYFDGSATGRAEFEFESTINNAAGRVRVTDVLTYFADQEVSVRKHRGLRGGGFDRQRFGDAAPLISDAFRDRSATKVRITEHDPASVTYCRPFIATVFHSREASVGEDFQECANTFNSSIKLYHDRTQIFGKSDIPVWAIEIVGKIPERDIRDLVLYLKRIHSESESLRKIVRFFQTSQIYSSLEYDFAENVDFYIIDKLDILRSADDKLGNRGAFAPSGRQDGPNGVDLALAVATDAQLNAVDDIIGFLKGIHFKRSSLKKKILDHFLRVQRSSQIVGTMIQEMNVSGDSYSGGDGSVVGRTVTIHGDFNQKWKDTGDISLDNLSTELEQLRIAMAASAESAEHYKSLAAVADAKVFSDKKDGPGALRALASAGQWALGIATTIGVAVATSALKKAMGVS